MKLADCMDEKKCPLISRDQLTNVFADLCWALLSNRIETYNANDSDKDSLTYSPMEWSMVFEKINNNQIRYKNDGISFNCGCCMLKNRGLTGACKWIKRDKCQHIQLLKAREFF